MLPVRAEGHSMLSAAAALPCDRGGSWSGVASQSEPIVGSAVYASAAPLSCFCAGVSLHSVLGRGPPSSNQSSSPLPSCHVTALPNRGAGLAAACGRSSGCGSDSPSAMTATLARNQFPHRCWAPAASPTVDGVEPDLVEPEPSTCANEHSATAVITAAPTT